MLLESVEVLNFRNLAGGMSFSPGLNILTGENGHGKTNWLEAIAVLADTRSFRTSRLQEAVAFEQGSATVRGRVRESEEIVRELQVIVSGNSKTLLVNGKKEPASRYLGQLHAVVFNSDELEIVRGGPDARRRFLDEGIVSLHPPFIQVISDYNRVLRQKSSLLQAARDRGDAVDNIADQLEPWNGQLAALASRIHRSRTRYVERLNEVLEKKLFGREELSIRYASSLEGKGDLSDYLGVITERLSMRVQAEIVAGHPLIGPHRDELEITSDGRDIRRFGSAGQQRSALLLLQIADINVFNATRGEYPLFMIDDIDAELDYRRIGSLLEYLTGKTQNFVTTSKENFAENFGSVASVFHIRNGTAKMS